MQLLSKKALAVMTTAGLQYDRDAIQPGILHFSTGNFHRAHQASYYHDLFETTNVDADRKWGIIEASVRQGGSYTEDVRPSLNDQDNLYTLVETDQRRVETHIIGSILSCLPYKKDHQPIKDMLLDENIKIASMTVTEGGYFIDTATGVFDPRNEDIQHDANNPNDPQTIFGLIVQALKHRRDQNLKPFTVMSCDNLPQKGVVARNTTVGLARLLDEDLADWIDQNVAFPCSMVDRITPAPTKELEESVKLDYEDHSMIFCEPFRQWVIENNFCNDRPSLDKVGAKFVNDVTPWEEAKLRILNAGHASMCYPAALLEIEFVHKAMDHDTISNFLDKMMANEILPQVPPVPNTNLKEYYATIRKRYQNPKLADRIDRNCENGSDRQTKFILPSLKACLQQGDDTTSVAGLATVSAMWCRYCMGETETGSEIRIKDELWETLSKMARDANDDPLVWVGMEEIYGDLGKEEKFQNAFENALKLCVDDGVEAAMKAYIDN
ncbi:mannitol dehydrogenase [Nitzschia inconspicua]|uniref:Mannitol dehydrogenase n=1 Tax=Nitzschia inconspicua TaxID=303405 RepID=A0A9K3KX50_9STRA|nr:mannitol dehydrogenase [Nitzschia inconspicua]KAG7365733.1 mannitol dehydrogenase [Nitzschia inconspicua]